MSRAQSRVWRLVAVAACASLLGACAAPHLVVLAPEEIRAPLEAALRELPGDPEEIETRWVPASELGDAAIREGGADVVIALGTDTLGGNPAVDGASERLLFADTVVLAGMASDEARIEYPQQLLSTMPGCLAIQDPHGSEAAGLAWDCLARQFPIEILDGIVRPCPSGADALEAVRKGECRYAVLARTQVRGADLRIAHTFPPETCPPIFVRGYAGSATRHAGEAARLLRSLVGPEGGAPFEKEGWVVLRRGIAR